MELKKGEGNSPYDALRGMETDLWDVKKVEIQTVKMEVHHCIKLYIYCEPPWSKGKLVMHKIHLWEEVPQKANDKQQREEDNKVVNALKKLIN